MIVTEMIDGFEYRYSDKNCYIKQNETGVLYTSALDCVPCAYTYSETDIEIEEEPTEGEE